MNFLRKLNMLQISTLVLHSKGRRWSPYNDLAALGTRFLSLEPAVHTNGAECMACFFD